MLQNLVQTFSSMLVQYSSYAWLMHMLWPLCIYCSSYLFTFLVDFFTFIQFKSVIELTGSVIEEKYDITTKFSKKVKALIYHINQHQMNDPRLRRLIEIPLTSYNTSGYGHDNVAETDYLIDQDVPLQLTNDIYCILKIKKSTYQQEKKSVKTRDVHITIYSRVLTVDDLKTFLNDIEKDYENHLNMLMNDNQFCLMYMKTDESGKLLFNTSVFSSTKTFDNLVSIQKDSLIKRIDFFLNNKDYYTRMGIPYTLGLFLYGAAGCGKTSTIKALANYTDRHIIIIPMTKITTFQSLRQIILDEEIDGFKIPNDKRLYVFEEIDCNGMENVIARRDLETKPISHSDSYENSDMHKLITAIGGQQLPENKKKKNAEDDKVTLGALLELLDGINEASGRILIMTSNRNPSLFDEALMRPGRIDMLIEFKPCTKEEVGKMYYLWFMEEIPPEVLDNVQEHVFSPAELGEIFIRNKDNPQRILDHLVSPKK